MTRSSSMKAARNSALIGFWLMAMGGAPLGAQPMEVITGGEIEYQRYCATCHGIDGRGQGVMTKYLTVAPPNLRDITRRHGGKFPFWEIYGKIDGSSEIPGHGTREMPVWGDRFRAAAGDDSKASLSQAAGRILSLVFYLQHIQD